MTATSRQVGAIYAILVAAVVAAVSGCSVLGTNPATTSQQSSGIVSDELGPDMRAYRQENLKPAGILVWFHGMDSDGTEFDHDPRQRHFAEPLMRNGWVIVSANAGGNSFGNDAALREYRALIGAARTRYGTTRLQFASESMGTVAALRLMAEPAYRNVNGLIGISPLTGIPPTLRGVDFIEAAWGGTVPDRADPLTFYPQRFAGKRFRFYYSTTDTVVPSGAGARAFAIRFGKVADVELVECRGDHADPTCYQGDDALAFVGGASR
ncbi:hypothetical protein [Gordonia sp. NPDC003585]|uniref:alpha/beta hydrolase n=1 Tax=Gordonia sp. NPDC003585 TaxID=3154275 RepID=UPI0033ADE5B0